MSATLDELIKQELWLFTMLFRHQIYLEGYKTGLAQGYVDLLHRLYGQFAVYLRQTRYKTMDAFTKVQLAQFIYRFNEAQGKFYSPFTQQLIDDLRAFLSADVTIARDIAETATGKTIADTTRSGIYGRASVETKAGEDRLWASVTNSPIPANGLLLQSMLTGFGTNMQTRTAMLIRKAYANAQPVEDFESDLFGTGDLFKGGLLGTFLAQFIAVIGVAVHHVSSEVQAAVNSLYFDQYEWCAILDNRTTEICRQRNGTVYVYGKGPLPPAHYGCRSKDRPILTDKPLFTIPQTYYDWLRTQPHSFIADVLGEYRAQQFEDGQLSATALGSISTVQPLTLEQFQGKVKFILGDLPDAA